LISLFNFYNDELVKGRMDEQNQRKRIAESRGGTRALKNSNNPSTNFN